MSHVHRQRTKLGLLCVYNKSNTSVSGRQGVQAALKTYSRVSGNGSIICVLKLVDYVVGNLGFSVSVGAG